MTDGVTMLQLAVTAMLVWMIAGLVTVKLAERAGRMWGYFPGSGWGCRTWVVLQAPGAIVDTLLSDAVWILLYGDEPLTPAHAHILWTILIDPSQDPDTALARFNSKP